MTPSLLVLSFQKTSACFTGVSGRSGAFECGPEEVNNYA
jgi:hypothetical protein